MDDDTYAKLLIEETERERDRVEEEYLSGRQDLAWLHEQERHVESRARSRVDEWRRRGTRESWSNFRRRIWKRDGGICQVCGISLTPDGWECGHIVDRMCGGSDLDDNLLVMCWFCNHLKPAHETCEAFEAWRAAGSPLATIVMRVVGTRYW